MSRRKKYRILAEAIVVVILIFLLVFFVGFRVTKVEIQGNKYYSDAQIKKMVLDVPIARNTILAMMINTEEKTKDAQLIEHVTLKRKNRSTLTVLVKEKQMIGCIQFEGKYVNFDRQGVIQIITEEPLEEVPLIDGLDVKEAAQGEKLKGINTKKLNIILSVGKMLEKAEQKPDRLVFNDMNQLVLYYGDIEVRMGDDENMDEKMNRLMGILPELEGMEGILHLEKITEETKSVVFDQEGAEESRGEDSQDPDQEAVRDTEEEPKQTDRDGEEDTEEQETSDGEETRDNSSGETEDDENQADKEQELQDSDLEYSDVEDSAEF